MLLKTKKTSKDRRRVIKNFLSLTPLQIKPKRKALELFGIPDLPLTLSQYDGVYFFQEKSGIIRSGVTVTFYEKYKEHFKIIKS